MPLKDHKIFELRVKDQTRDFILFYLENIIRKNKRWNQAKDWLNYGEEKKEEIVCQYISSAIHVNKSKQKSQTCYRNVCN